MNIRSRATIAALVLAIAGLALPAAASATRQAGRANDTSDVISRYLRNRSGAQASKPKPEMTPAVQMARHFQHEDALYRASAPTSGRSALAAQVATSHGFDWNDALVGAGVALAIVLLLSATGIGVVRHRHSHLKRRLGITAFSGRRTL